MQVSLNLGTVNITNQEVVKFIQNGSIDELKSIITDFLNNQVNLVSNKPTKPKGKWGAFADRMSGLTTPEITEHIQKTSLDMRNGFEFRELNNK